MGRNRRKEKEILRGNSRGSSRGIGNSRGNSRGNSSSDSRGEGVVEERSSRGNSRNSRGLVEEWE